MTRSRRTSLRALARLIGVSEAAVRKARRAGVFSAAAVTYGKNGSYVVSVTPALFEWVRSGRQLRKVGWRSIALMESRARLRQQQRFLWLL